MQARGSKVVVHFAMKLVCGSIIAFNLVEKPKAGAFF